MLTITGKTLGKKKPLFADWSIPLPPELGDGGSLTLRDLLTRIVRAEVQAFRDRQREKQLLRALTRSDIEQGTVRGKIVSGGQEGKQGVSEDESVAVALEAF